MCKRPESERYLPFIDETGKTETHSSTRDAAKMTVKKMHLNVNWV